MSQFEKAVKLSDEQFLRAVGVDKTAFNLKGSVHDYRILKESRLAISPETEKLADSGYQSIAKLYANSSTPIKKCWSTPLTQEPKQFNRRLARHRLSIEYIV